MKTTQARRHFLMAALSVLGTRCAPSEPIATARDRDERDVFAKVEARVGGRLGVFAVDTGTSRALGHRPDERFAMCSTFKWLLAAAILARVDRGELSLTQAIPYQRTDLLDYAPVTREHLKEGSMSVADLTRACVTLSDNTAANLLLEKLGGPGAVTEFARSFGDEVTRLDRNEPALNQNATGDLRDTTSPRAMAYSMRAVLCGTVLASASRERLLGWLRGCATGKTRLRAGFPSGWLVGDKTGSGQNNAVNDIAIAAPSGRAPIIVAVYTSGSQAEFSALEHAHREVAEALVRHL